MNRAKGLLRFVTIISLIPLMILVLILACLLALPVFPFLLGFRLYRKRRFCRLNAGRWFLVVSRRRGWYDFILNNVLPVLPPQASCVWVEQPHREPRRDQNVLLILGRHRRGVRKPFMVVVESRRLKVVHLHDQLRPFKQTRAQDETVREAISALLTAAGHGA